MNDPASSGLPVDPEATKVDMRTREGRAIRAQQAAQRQQREPPRQTAPREPMREPARGGVVVGRDGETLSRRRRDDGKDIFDIPAELKEPGWSYQWCAISIAGNSDILMDQNLMFAENGWRAVPAERWPGRFMPAGHKGPIIRGQQMLMERPLSLTLEAEAENKAKAQAQMRDRDQSLMGGKAALRAQMRNGFEMGGKYRGTGGDLKMSIDPGLDIPRPQHELAEPGE